MVDTIMVGINRSGIISKKKREINHVVGLLEKVSNFGSLNISVEEYL